MYLWIKALHVIAVVAWMAGLLYLPRLFVYHAQSPSGAMSETFKVMERKLLRYIMNPAMIVVFVSGVYLIVAGDHWREHWLHAKVLLVLLMAGAHGFDARCVRRFASNANEHSARFFRIANEVPTLLMIAIVILVIVRPFS